MPIDALAESVAAFACISGRRRKSRDAAMVEKGAPLAGLSGSRAPPRGEASRIAPCVSSPYTASGQEGQEGQEGWEEPSWRLQPARDDDIVCHPLQDRVGTRVVFIEGPPIPCNVLLEVLARCHILQSVLPFRIILLNISHAE